MKMILTRRAFHASAGGFLLSNSLLGWGVRAAETRRGGRSLSTQKLSRLCPHSRRLFRSTATGPLTTSSLTTFRSPSRWRCANWMSCYDQILEWTFLGRRRDESGRLGSE